MQLNSCNRLLLVCVMLMSMAVMSIAQQVVVENGRAYKLHVVEKGEGLYRLSVNNNVSQEEIIAANPQLKTSGMVVGMTLRIPMKETAPKATAVAESANYTTHQVAKGETAYSISRKYEMPLTDFYQLNPNAQTGVSEGQIVKVKGIKEKPSAYRIHVIQAGETLYSIGVKYGVKAADIVAANPVLDVNAMPIGSLLRIPDTDIPVEDAYFIYHHIAAGETLFSLGQKYNMAQDKIMATNPDIIWSALQVGQIVAVPKIGAKKVSYTTHEVERKETLYSITHKYEISSEQLAEANPGIDVYALQKGQVLQIPHYEAADDVNPATINPLFVGVSTGELQVDDNYSYESLGQPTINVALMLPFDAENESYKIRMARNGSTVPTFKTYRFIEFYQGVRMALDTLSSKGTNVKLKVFDTSNKMTLASISQMTEPEFDLIIGPARADEMHSVAEMAQINRIPMVLPFGQMDSVINDNPYLFQASVIDTITTNVVVDNIVKDCVGKNVILLTYQTKNKADIKRYERVKQQCAKLGIELQSITFDASKHEKFLSMLSMDQENVLLMPTTAEAQINSTIVGIAGIIDQKKNVKVSLYGMGEWLTFQTIEVEVFHKLNTQIYTTFALDYEDGHVKNILDKYRRDYFTEPVAFTPYFQKTKGLSGYSEYGLWGYDVAMKFVTAYRLYGKDLIRKINTVKTESSQSNFVFEKLTNWGGQVNVGLRKVSFAPDNRITVNNIE